MPAGQGPRGQSDLRVSTAGGRAGRPCGSLATGTRAVAGAPSPPRRPHTAPSPAAQAALVKSRDMHWSLLAQRAQRDVSLSSLRLLLVADGANPCE